MYLIAIAILLVLLIIRFGLRLAGFRMKPWLPQSGRARYRIDLAITALFLVLIAWLLGVHPSFGMALVIAVVASVVVAGLEAMRKGKAIK
jgi:hypothetical protein